MLTDSGSSFGGAAELKGTTSASRGRTQEVVPVLDGDSMGVAGLRCANPTSDASEPSKAVTLGGTGLACTALLLWLGTPEEGR
mmetsp:Transcript_45973/g.74771  ORF Transcript_45973/g.74771 Transcript_45973/m.74771 type:complete len:83 (-) Transcript_45973:195-443(-)